MGRPAAWLHQSDELVNVRGCKLGFFCQLLLRALLVPAPTVKPRVSDLVKSLLKSALDLISYSECLFDGGTQPRELDDHATLARSQLSNFVHDRVCQTSDGGSLGYIVDEWLRCALDRHILADSISHGVVHLLLLLELVLHVHRYHLKIVVFDLIMICQN